MSGRERSTSRAGNGKRPKVEASTILEALNDLGEALHDPGRSATVMEIALYAGVSRNTASDRLAELSAGGFLVTKERRKTGHRAGRNPEVFTITENGINAVLLIRRKRELLAADVEFATQGERFDRAAEALEREAEAIEARIAKEPALPEVDPRQILLPIVIEIPGLADWLGRSEVERGPWPGAPNASPAERAAASRVSA